MRGQKIEYTDNHKIQEDILYKQCNQHNIYFPDENEWFPCTEEYFYKNDKNKIDGLYPYCKRCNIKKSQNFDKRNPEYKRIKARGYYNREEKRLRKREEVKRKPEKYKNTARNWRKNNPDKCIEYSKLHRKHDVSLKEEKSMLQVFNYSCAYCGMTLEEHLKINHQKLHNEHVDNNGYNDLRNDVPACRRCNSGKHEDNFEEWFRKQEFFNEERLAFIKWWITDGYKDYIEEKPPYRILKKKNKVDDKIYYELWTVDEKRNLIECVAIEKHKKDLDLHIKKLIET